VKNDIHSFGVQLDKFAKTVNVDVEKVVRRVSLDLWKRITVKTPVDTGRARANWMISAKTPSGNQLPEGEYSDPPTPSVSNQGYDSVFVTNNLDYIGALEDGHSKLQSPEGMVAVSIAEVQAGLMKKLT
jgi:hypothetical protein